jgi:hypothetical protein
MDHLLLDLEIEAASLEYVARRIVARGGTRPPQPIVTYLDHMPEDEREPDEMPEPPDTDDPWDELTAECQRLGSGPETVGEMTERMLGKMGV